MVENFMQLEVHWNPFNNYGCIYFYIWNDGKTFIDNKSSKSVYLEEVEYSTSLKFLDKFKGDSDLLEQLDILSSSIL